MLRGPTPRALWYVAEKLTNPMLHCTGLPCDPALDRIRLHGRLPDGGRGGKYESAVSARVVTHILGSALQILPPFSLKIGGNIFPNFIS